jgi:hypothetical protein
MVPRPEEIVLLSILQIQSKGPDNVIKRMKSACVIAACLMTAGIWAGPWPEPAAGAESAVKHVDVNDISILWPAPKTVDDVKKLISLNEKLADGTTAIWPEAAFKQLIQTAPTVTVTGSGGQVAQIDFADNAAAFSDPSNWKIAGIRIDPSAPGCSDKIIGLFGSSPQIRLIVQPVTVQGTTVTVHDVTAHLVFSFVTGNDAPLAPGLPPRAIADRQHFQAILDDVLALKAALLAAGVSTDGDLTVHPGLKANKADCAVKLKGLLQKHLSADRLGAMAFMGLDFPEPWIFFAMAKRNGQFVRVGHPTLPTEQAQMLQMRGGDHIMPTPVTLTFGKGSGVSTAKLFENVDLSSIALTTPAAAGGLPIAFRDIPDIIANPQISHFFSTDCLSCHTESNRRSLLAIQGQSAIMFSRPAGVSGVNKALLPQKIWNLRCFGWFPDFFKNGEAVESIAMRTANEAAESAAFINRTYLSAAAQPATPASPAAPVVAVGQPTAPLHVANALTLVMTIKTPADRVQLKALVNGMQKLPPDQNPITVALTKLGNVHFARFVFIGDDKLAVITTYDDDFDTYIHSFAKEIGGVFDQLLAHMKDAPPLPVKDHQVEFLKYVKANDLTCEQPFYSAYPTLKVQDILTLQKNAQK